MQLQGGDIMSSFEHVSNLIEKEIPEQAKNLSDNVVNLEKVAQYCEDIYVNSKAPDKQIILNQTKDYTTQALASVAYQIHVLANSFLQLLDNQSAILNDMGISMTHLTHEVKIYKEKVARREIGVLTTNKCVVRTLKVKKPDADEKPVKYIRKPIDYSILDDIGHGVKLPRQASNLDPLSKIGVGRQNSYSSTHSSSGITGGNGSVGVGGASTGSGPIGKPPDIPTPPLPLKTSTIINAGGGLGTVRSTASGSSSYYRTPVIPPSVPSEYLSRQELGIYSSKKELNQSAGADSLSGVYGYRRPSQQSNNNPNTSMNTSGVAANPNNNNGSEYSGTDTLDRRMTNTYLQQFNYPNNAAPGIALNSSLMSNNNSVGYASGKELNIIRTNLNNIDYATNGTMYRRPQLHPSIYERSMPLQQPAINAVGAGSVHSGPDQMRLQQNIPSQQQQQQPHNPPPQRGGVGVNNLSNNNSSILSNNSSLHGLPPPPILFASNNNDGGRVFLNLADGSTTDNLENEVFGVDYLDRDDDDDIIPNWVPIERCIEKVITTYDYEGLNDDELTFKENMYIYVIKKNDDHWYEGIMKNERDEIVQGLYPYNYARCVRKYIDDSRVTQC